MSEPEDQFFDIERFEPCDSCRAKSYVWACMPSGGTLTYCAHHATKYMDGLLRQEAYIYDRRDAVLER